MNQQKLKQLKRKAKHSQQQVIQMAKMKAKAHKIIQNHIDTPKDLFGRLGYIPNVRTQDINHNYDLIVKPIVDELTQNSTKHYNHKDNRTLFADLDYIENAAHYKMFSGVVLNYKYINDKPNRPAKLYILVGAIYAMVKDIHGKGYFHICTDHLWLDVNDFRGMFGQYETEITVGIGDKINFYAKTKEYKGYREHIYQTKWGVTSMILTASGYPKINLTKDKKAFSINVAYNVNYSHHDAYLFKLTKPTKEQPKGAITFGDQLGVKQQYYLTQSVNHRHVTMMAIEDNDDIHAIYPFGHDFNGNVDNHPVND